MTYFLTSSPCVIGADQAILSNANGFVDRLRWYLPEAVRCLFICSNPDSYFLTDQFGNDMVQAFREAGIPFTEYTILDGRNEQFAQELIASSNFIILSGGHVPTQNAFFRRIGLRELLEGYEGVIMGVSAGSMNSNDTVYAQPEEPGESVDPDFELWLPGLGLTDIQILPHYQQVCHNILDGKRLYEDITYAHSFGHRFFALVDGSYLFKAEDTHPMLFGEAYLIEDGKLMQIAEEGQVTHLP